MTAIDTRKGGRLAGAIAVAATATMMISATVALLGGGSHGSWPGSQTTTYHVTRSVRMRDQPTATGSAVLASLERGQAVRGIYAIGADGTTPWLRTSREGVDGYVWRKNLSTQPRPVLESVIEQTWTVSQRTAIYSEVGTNRALLDTLQPGVRITVVGAVAGGQLEVAMRGGGVGYLPRSAVGPY